MKRVLLHTNVVKNTIDVKGKLIRKLLKSNMDIVEENPDIIVVIGGDGTMLTAIREYNSLNIPFVGINTGTLGFLPGYTLDELDLFIEDIKDEKFEIQSYPLIKVRVKTIRESYIERYAFNEVIIKHLEPRLMEARVYFNDEEFNYYTGDGFIVSTPIGATGYAIWAGGAAMHSDLQVLEVTPLSPNDNRVNRPLMTSMIMPVQTKIDINVIKAESRQVIVACDGIRISNDYISEIEITAADKAVKIIRDRNYSYYNHFREKIIDKNIIRG